MYSRSICELRACVEASALDSAVKNDLSLILDKEERLVRLNTEMLGERIREARLKKGYQTCGEFAKVIARDESTVRRWENGTIKPDLDMLVILCHFLSVTPNDLLS